MIRLPRLHGRLHVLLLRLKKLLLLLMMMLMLLLLLPLLQQHIGIVIMLLLLMLHLQRFLFQQPTLQQHPILKGEVAVSVVVAAVRASRGEARLAEAGGDAGGRDGGGAVGRFEVALALGESRRRWQRARRAGARQRGGVVEHYGAAAERPAMGRRRRGIEGMAPAAHAGVMLRQFGLLQLFDLALS